MQLAQRVMENPMKLYSYLNFNGNCRAAFDFYAQHLGGKITMMLTHEQAPNPDQVPPSWKKAILHARMTIGETELLAADIPDAHPMRSAYLTLIVDSIHEAERIYTALSEGGEIFMPMAETPFAVRFAQFRDRFSVNWMILQERPMP
jgi:PhnB protein